MGTTFSFENDNFLFWFTQPGPTEKNLVLVGSIRKMSVWKLAISYLFLCSAVQITLDPQPRFGPFFLCRRLQASKKYILWHRWWLAYPQRIYLNVLYYGVLGRLPSCLYWVSSTRLIVSMGSGMPYQFQTDRFTHNDEPSSIVFTWLTLVSPHFFWPQLATVVTNH